MKILASVCLVLLLVTSSWAADSRVLTDTDTITWDFSTAGQAKANVVPAMVTYWNGNAIIKDGNNCTAANDTTINSGPRVPVFVCADNNSSIFGGDTFLSIAITSATFTLAVSDVDSSSHVFAGAFSAMCRANDAAINSTWGTGVDVSITMATANDIYTVESTAVTPDGTCSAGSWLFWRFVVNATNFTDDGDARIIGVGMEAQ